MFTKIISKRTYLYNTSFSILFLSFHGGRSGVSKNKISTVEVTAETEKEVMTLDDDETFGNFYKTVSPTSLHDSSMVLTEEDFSQIHTNTPKLVYNNNIFDHLNDLWVPFFFSGRWLTLKLTTVTVFVCFQAHVSRNGTQESGPPPQEEPGLQEPSAGPRCSQRHPTGLHRAEAQRRLPGDQEDPSGEE